VRVEEGGDRLRVVPAGIGRDGDNLEPVSLRAEQCLRRLQMADDQRADVRAVGVDEGHQDRLAVVFAQVDRFPERVVQFERRRRLRRRGFGAGKLAVAACRVVDGRVRAAAAATAGDQQSAGKDEGQQGPPVRIDLPALHLGRTSQQ
jgi:hypothetical protein